MARAQGTDFYHAFKFHLVDSANKLNRLAGFNTLTMPEYTIEAVEYQEGIWTYRRKFPGNVTVSDVTLTHGVIKRGTNFFQWIKDAIEGKAYRVDFNILHFHRDDVQGLIEYTNASPSRIIRCYEAFPIRAKVGSDFDSMSSDVSLEELDLAIERFEIEYPK